MERMLQQRVLKTVAHVGLSGFLLTGAVGCSLFKSSGGKDNKEQSSEVSPRVSVESSEEWQQEVSYEAPQGSENLSSRSTFINSDCKSNVDTPAELRQCLSDSLARGFFAAEGVDVDNFTDDNVLPKVSYKSWAKGESLKHLGISESQARDILGVVGETRTMTFRKVLNDGRTVLATTQVVLVNGAPASNDQLNVNELFWGIVFQVNNITKVAFVEDLCENPMGLIITITPLETPTPAPLATSTNTAIPPTPESSATPQSLPPTSTREASATPQTNPLTPTPVVPTATAIPSTFTAVPPTREASATPQTNPLTPTVVPRAESTAVISPNPTATTTAPTTVPTTVPTVAPTAVPTREGMATPRGR